ncbi:MAG: enoyl-CoA hydratase/isomerase family protein [Deltaproteobacteria bacterium]|nr:enoyl-CoA hydratase/isomerase family protein [Deltaproteobacteria bacterium]
MSTSHILYDISDRIGTIILNRPEVMNALGGTMREDLLSRLEQAEHDPTVRCVIITGAGTAFCAGGDIANMVEMQARNDASILAQRMTLGGKVVQFIRQMTKPVIAAINGAAAGAGMNLALACDIRYGSDRARFAESFVKIGLVPDWGGHYLLTQMVGTSRALELIMTGDRIDAEEAYRLGLINRIFPHDSFQEEVRSFAARLTDGPAETLAQIKRGVYIGATTTLAETLAHEEQAQARVFLSADAREGMRAFLEKRPPQFGK